MTSVTDKNTLDHHYHVSNLVPLFLEPPPPRPKSEMHGKCNGEGAQGARDNGYLTQVRQ